MSKPCRAQLAIFYLLAVLSSAAPQVEEPHEHDGLESCAWAAGEAVLNCTEPATFVAAKRPWTVPTALRPKPPAAPRIRAAC